VKSEIPDAPPATRGGLLKRTRRVAALAFAALVLTTFAGCDGDGDAAAQPTTPTPAPTETTPTALGPTNGQIVNAHEYLTGAPRLCQSCRREFVRFDPASGTGLFVDVQYVAATDENHLSRMTVVGPEGRAAGLSCPKDFACEPELWASGAGATLGPAADEITLRSDDHSLQVIAYDGSLRRTLDLSAVLGDEESLVGLAWSPDRSQLAVHTVKPGGSREGRVSRVLLFHADGGGAQRVYTATFPVSGGDIPLAYLSGLAWSLDGKSLGVVENHEVAHPRPSPIAWDYRGVWQGVVVLRLPAAGKTGSAAAETLYQYRRPTWGAAQIAWSPDGTRLAVTVKEGVLELSADDGEVLTRHPRLKGAMIWLKEI